MSDLYCPMIHGGLNICLKNQNNDLSYNQCCLSSYNLTVTDNVDLLWESKELTDLRKLNDNNQWHPDCWQCERLENAGVKSFRQGMIDKFGVNRNLSGPQRIDLLFDRSCNLACLTCGPESSTFWHKHLVENNLPVANYATKSNYDTVEQTLRKLDLSNLGMVQFCGGETLLGNTYWKTAELISELVPNSVNNIELGFQTNGTQPIDEKNFKTLEKFKLVKFLISLDGVGPRFDYLRWPASWQQVVDNIMTIREKAPVNIMFFVQETTSCLNLFYFNEVSNWVKENFSDNRLGDPVGHTTQLAKHDIFDVNFITEKYFSAIKNTPMRNFLDENWTENPAKIREMLRTLDSYDKIRGTDWQKTFPEVAEFYSDYRS